MYLTPTLFLLTLFAADLNVGLFDELSPLFPDSLIGKQNESIEIDSPRNTIASVHLLVKGLQVGVPVKLLANAPGEWYELLTVPVEENTGTQSRTEQFNGEENPNVIRDAPFNVFEVMKPIDASFIPGKNVVAIRYELKIKPDAKVSKRTIKLTVQQQEEKITKEVELKIFPVIIPEVGKETLGYTNWFDLTRMTTYHGIEPYSPLHWEMVEKYAALMKRGRQNTFWLAWTDYFSESFVLDKQKLKTYIDRFTNAGLWWIEGAPIAHRPNGDWSSPNLQLNIGGSLTNTKEGLKTLTDTSLQMMDAIREFGLEDRWIQHIADEPTDTNATEYKEVSKVFHKTMPNIPVIEATMSRELVGAVDIWCPQVQKYQLHFDFFIERQDAGEEVWTYTCLIPGGKWLNRLLDMERLRQVYIGWAASKYNLDGYLHWGLNQYQTDPFLRSVVDHPATPNTTNKLPAGDTHVIYPGEGGPWSGLRFEAHRIGFEDYELLKQLKLRDEPKYTEIIAEVFTQYDEYETDVAEYRKTRAALLNALKSE